MPPYYDIVGELYVRSICSVADSIFFYLDWTSVKNASLVSKAWREAALAALKTIISAKGNPNWSLKQKRLWEKARTHLAFDFHIPQDEPNFTQCFANSTQLAFERMQKGFTAGTSLELTLDYLPFSIGIIPDRLNLEDCCYEMNEKFIVSYDHKTRRLNYWSRRTLLPLNLDEEFRMQKYPRESGGVGMHFQLSGNYLIYGELSLIDDDYDVISFTKVDLDAKCRGIHDKETVTVTTARLEPPNVHGSQAGICIRHIGVVEDLILLVLQYNNDEPKFRLSVLWRIEEAEGTQIDLRFSMLRIPTPNVEDDLDCFLDAN